MKPYIAGEHELFAGNHLVFRKLEYVDCNSVVRSWETVDRKGGSCRSGDGKAAAVIIIARIVPDDEILLIRQFRPPAGKLMIEFPAGLIDPGETPKQAAVRELFEETGFDGKVLFTQSPSYSSPGMTGESVILTVMEIDGSRYDQGLPEAHPEECEHIEVFRVKVAELAEFIAEQENAGCGIDSKIYTYLAMRRIGF